MKKSVLMMMSLLFVMTAFSQEGSYRLWKNSTNQASIEKMRIKTTEHLLKSLDLQSFRKLLPTVHKLPSDRSYSNTIVLGIPMPGDVMATFRVRMSDIMDPVLEAKYPDIRTFNGQGISDPRATIVLDYNLNGVHAMVLTPSGDYFIDPAFTGNTTDYLVYYRKDLIKTYIFEEGAPIKVNQEEPAQLAGKAPAVPDAPQNVAAVNCTGKSLRKYRMAIACTGEYAVAATGKTAPTKAQTLSCVQTTFARVVGVYEKELAITMVLVAKEDTIIFTTASTDPFAGNNNANTLINESQTVIDKYIGSANYDVGHTFSTGGGGLSSLGVICSNGSKASSITGSPTPTGDGYDIDYVAHEMGHAYGADHTFNDNTKGSCAGNYSNTTNNEPGSGITIMAYAGICTGDDLGPHSLPIFTAMSFNEIEKYNTTGIGRTCAVNIATTNNPPVVALTPDYTIPFKTPFRLMGSASDPNGDSLTYCWEQVNVGGNACVWNAPRTTLTLGEVPIFRTFNPVTDSFRVFPKMRAVVLNKDTIGELKPTYARTLKFRLTARDNRSGGGGVCYNENNVIVAAVTDSFWVKYPTVNTVTWVTGHADSVTWNVTGTNVAPINCAKVAIDLSIDGGYTYPYTLVDSTPNTGKCSIFVPGIVSANARIRVRSIGNIFFAISKANFTIKAHGLPVVLNLFNGFANAGTNQLYWNSVTETGTDYYQLEKSADGKNFTDIAKVKALGNSTSSKDYTYPDENVGSQDWYYRLRMVDLNGAVNYSNIIKIARNSNKSLLSVYPNPATEKIVVAHNKMQNAQLNIYNLQGQLVYTEKLNPTTVATEININKFSNGYYSIIINDDNTIYKTKFIKTK